MLWPEGSECLQYGVHSGRILCTASEMAAFIPRAGLHLALASCFHVGRPLYLRRSYTRTTLAQDDIENTLWLDLLRSFVAVKNLHLSEEFVPRIAPAVQEFVGERTTEVLPTLKNVFLEGFQPSGPLHGAIEKFVVARRLTCHTVAVSRWDREERE
jgi:hypothetical protein